jgi:SAM-dependent methyltransferase
MNLPTIKEVYNNVASTYDSEYQQEQYILDELRTGELLDNLYPHWDIISQGIGTGQDYFMASPLVEGCTMIGLDISEEMLKIAKAKYPDIITQVWDCSEPFPGRADTILSLYGTINYVGLQSFIRQIQVSGANKFFGVMFSPTYRPALAPHLVKYYTIEEVYRAFDEAKLRMTLRPLHQYETFDTANYWVISSA